MANKIIVLAKRSKRKDKRQVVKPLLVHPKIKPDSKDTKNHTGTNWHVANKRRRRRMGRYLLTNILSPPQTFSVQLETQKVAARDELENSITLHKINEGSN